jgi:hypothetical protein
MLGNIDSVELSPNECYQLDKDPKIANVLLYLKDAYFFKFEKNTNSLEKNWPTILHKIKSIVPESKSIPDQIGKYEIRNEELDPLIDLENCQLVRMSLK